MKMICEFKHTSKLELTGYVQLKCEYRWQYFAFQTVCQIDLEFEYTVRNIIWIILWQQILHIERYILFMICYLVSDYLHEDVFLLLFLNFS